MTTGDAAKLLHSRGVRTAANFPMDAQAVRRLCKDGLIEFGWSRADAVREDVNGRPLRGHRMVYRDSVEEYARRRLHIAKESPPPHS